MVRRFGLVVVFACSLTVAQEPPLQDPAVAVAAPTATAEAPVAAMPAAIPVDAAPLGPVDPNTPYASPRDAARHRMQATFTLLETKRDLRAGVRGFGEAVALDPTYAAAVFNLSIVAAIAGQWQDAVAALEHAGKLDPSNFGPHASSQLERWRLIATMEQTEEGKRRRRYDEALLPVLHRLAKANATESLNLLAAVAQIDPTRWEAPALLGGVYGDIGVFETAAKFLAIAESNAKDAAVKAAIAKARAAADREVRYAKSRMEADIAADNGDHAKAATLYEQAWAVIPARTENGIEAASALLLGDDTAKAAIVLTRLADRGNEELATASKAMLKELQAIEPTAGKMTSDAGQFFQDPGTPEVVRVSSMLPAIDQKPMELLVRPMPKLVRDEEAVMLLASISVDAADAAQAFLPALPEPRVAGEQPWREVHDLKNLRSVPQPVVAEPELQTVALSSARTARPLNLTSTPAGASVMIDDKTEATCRTPCEVRIEPGKHTLKAALDGYVIQDQEANVTASGAATEFILQPVRGSVFVDCGTAVPVKVNGVLVTSNGSAELALLPGIHRIEADHNGTARTRVLNVKAGAKLRIRLQP